MYKRERERTKINQIKCELCENKTIFEYENWFGSSSSSSFFYFLTLAKLPLEQKIENEHDENAHKQTVKWIFSEQSDANWVLWLKTRHMHGRTNKWKRKRQRQRRARSRSRSRSRKKVIIAMFTTIKASIHFWYKLLPLAVMSTVRCKVVRYSANGFLVSPISFFAFYLSTSLSFYMFSPRSVIYLETTTKKWKKIKINIHFYPVRIRIKIFH